MRAVVQRVKYSKIEVDQELISEIGVGLMVLLGVSVDDTEEDAEYMIKKIPELRIFEDEEEKMNLTVKDVQGSIQIISQFTLYGDARKGRRPSFIEAARPELGLKLYELVCEKIEALGHTVKRGSFGADMQVSLLNDGPVTILLDSKRGF
ncbi:D-aminoacyl-tRNA deacylase [Guggenheimella bovis]